MVYKTYQLGRLSAAQLLPYLQHQIDEYVSSSLYESDKNNSVLNEKPSWYVCWLNNNNQSVIGLLPKTTWTMWSYHPECRMKEIDGETLKSESPQITIINSHRTLINSAKSIDIDLQQSKSTGFNKYPAYSSTESISDYNLWQQQLIEYCQQHHLDECFDNPNEETTESKTNLYSVYQHGLMGFIGYDISAQALSPKTYIKTANQPSAFLGHYDIYIRQNKQGEWLLCHHLSTDKSILFIAAEFLERLDDTFKSKHEQALVGKKSFIQTLNAEPIKLQACWNITDYKRAFEETQNYLYKGDSYQINLTQKWQGLASVSATSSTYTLLNHLPTLFSNTQAPFAGYLTLTDKPQFINLGNQSIDRPTDETPLENTYQFELLSCSPELFVTFKQDKEDIKVITKPIKGTRPRGTTPIEDQQLKEALQQSEKDKAENVMIVDLLRNDLGKYAQTGSVQVPHLFSIETFSNVHHMVSTVTATIEQKVHPLTVLFNSLPAGSITGAPKKRSVEIISELEVAARGAYCGTMGYMNFDGTGQWNVLIRTLQASQNEVSLWAGGGITVGSECAAEYQECFDKISNLLHLLNHPV